MRGLIPISILACAVLGIVYMAQNPEPLGGSTETNGDLWRRLCKVEAGPTKHDQDECFSKYAVTKALENSNADFEKRAGREREPP